MLCGGTDTSNHTTLLWQRADGKYVQNNYGKSFTIDATNMKDAAREVYKHDLGLINNGYMYFVDDKGSYQEFNMKEEAVWGDELDKRDYNNETLFSHNIASQPSINAKVNYSVTGSVSAEVKGTLAYGNSDTSKETSFSLAYKKSGETALADNSQSIGAKIEHLGERIKQSGKTFFGTKVVVDYTKLTTDFLKNKRNYFNCAKSKYIKGEEFVNKLNELLSEMYNNYSKSILTEAEYIENYINDSTCDGIPVRELSDENLKNQLLEEITAIATESYKEYKQDILTEDQFRQNTMSSVLNFNALLGDTDCVDSEQFETTNLTAFVRKYFGGEKTLLKDDGIELSTGYQLSGLLGLNAVTSSEFVFGGDLRLAAEEGLKLSINNKTNHFGTEVSGGVVADFALKNGTLTPTVSPGIKLNASTEYQTKIADNAMLGAKLSGYSTVTRPSSDYGLSGQLQSVYKLKNSDITIFSSVNCGVDKQQLTIGQFNEQTENIISYGASVGAQIGKNTTVGLNYNKSDNKLNPTRNREQISVMARVNL